ncbi:MAG: D-aminoacyl-tRNA deacylase [Chlamydiia bacterium]|nr:D-aminoacyl-tRNA deacylase [Chlamydiia bacterium]
MDSHAHLTSTEYSMDADGAIKRALSADITKIMNICTSPQELKEGLALQQKYPDVIKNIACTTPHDADKETKETFAFFEKHAKAGDLVAVGETGFDDFIEPENIKEQKGVCRSYIDLAVRESLPVVFHVRGDGAFENVFEAASEFPSFKGIIHCFTGSQQQAEKALALGWSISISGIATFKKSQELREIIKTIPMDRLLIETDSPWLAPHGYRGKPNEPAYVKVVAETIADVHEISVDQVLESTFQNGSQLFLESP